MKAAVSFWTWRKRKKSCEIHNGHTAAAVFDRNIYIGSVAGDQLAAKQCVRDTHKTFNYASLLSHHQRLGRGPGRRSPWVVALHSHRTAMPPSWWEAYKRCLGNCRSSTNNKKRRVCDVIQQPVPSYLCTYTQTIHLHTWTEMIRKVLFVFNQS